MLKVFDHHLGEKLKKDPRAILMIAKKKHGEENFKESLKLFLKAIRKTIILLLNRSSFIKRRVAKAAQIPRNALNNSLQLVTYCKFMNLSNFSLIWLKMSYEA